MEIRFAQGGPLDGVKMLVDPGAYKITARAKNGNLTAIYEREEESEKFVFAGFED